MASSTLQLSQQLLVGEMLKRASHKAPNDEAYIFNDKRITYKELDERATQIAGWLQAQGIEKDDKVGMLLKNSLAFVEVTFGIVLSGGVAVPINFRLTANEVEYIVQNSDSKILFIDADYVEMIEKIKDRLSKVEKIIVIDAKNTNSDTISYESIFDKAAVYRPCESLIDDDASFIVYTSGTTGRPKGAVLTHKNVCQNCMNMMWEVSMKHGDSTLICVPQFHIAGLLMTLNGCLTLGKTVIQREFNPMNVLEALEREQINFVFLVPAMWNFLFQVPNIDDFDLTSVKIAGTGAAIAPLELKKRILKYFPNAMLTDSFGQSETTATTTCLKGEDAIRKTTSVGKPYINVEVRVVDEEMNDVPIGEVGEIVYRGPTVMKEYYKNPEATKEAFKGGWFHSGDLVKMDEEGYIYVVDRKKNMIISGGENIYPAEIEEVLYQMSEILECAVIGVPDEKWGESVKAVIVLKPGATLTEQQVIDYCKEHLASYKKPKYVEFIDELPRNAAGKVLKYVLQQQATQVK